MPLPECYDNKFEGKKVGEDTIDSFQVRGLSEFGGGKPGSVVGYKQSE